MQRALEETKGRVAHPLRIAVGVIILLLILSGDIESNPGPVGQLTLEDLSEVIQAVHGARAKWYHIGLQLKLLVGTLDAIRSEFSDTTDCLTKMCSHWLRSINPRPSWAALTKALESPPVGEEHLAQQLKKYHGETEEMITNSPAPGRAPPVASSTSQGMKRAHPTDGDGKRSTSLPEAKRIRIDPKESSVKLSSQLQGTADQQVPLRMQELEGKFLDIADRTTEKIQKKNMDTEDFRRKFITQMQISKQEQHKQFIDDYLMKIEPTTSVTDLLCRLGRYWNFLNYNLLQHLVSMFGDEKLKHDMEDYVQELKVFRANTKLCDFIDNWPLQRWKPSKADFSKLVMKKLEDKEWDECTLEDVEMFEETLTHKFLLPDFVLQLVEAEKGCICLTWYIPAPIAIIIQEDLPNIEAKFFKTHRIERVAIDGKEFFLTPTKMFSTYLKGVYSSEKPLESSLEADKPLDPFSFAKIETKELKLSNADKFTKNSIRGDNDDVMWQKKPMSIDEVGILPDGSQAKLVLIEGAPGVGKTTFSWDFCKKWARGEVLQGYSLVVLLPLRDNRLKEATGMSDLFYHPDPNIQKAVLEEVESTKGKGVLIWLEAFDELDEDKRTRSSIFLDLIYGNVLADSTIFLTSRPWATASVVEKCKEQVIQRTEILASADLQFKQRVEKTKSDPDTTAKFIDYVSLNPAVKAMMYTRVTADMVFNTFLCSRDTEFLPPTTMTELYTTFTLTSLHKYMSSHAPVHGRKQRKTLAFNNLPDDIQKYFTKLCEVAFRGILNGHQTVFQAEVDFDSLRLMRETPQLYMRKGDQSSFDFLHLTLQEYLAAVHISRLQSRERIELIEQHLRDDHFKMVFRFLAGLTKLENITQNIIQQLLGSYDQQILLHWLFESHNDVTTMEVLCSHEMYIRFTRTWTPLDFYVTGYSIAHSECDWSLGSDVGCIDNEKMELFSKGCQTSSIIMDGCISNVEFSRNYITSEGVLHFLKIPQHIRQGIRKLNLNGNELDTHACDLLAKAVPEMPELEELDFDYNRDIGNGGAVALISALYTSRVKTLRLENTGIGEKDCVCLSELLNSNHHLEHLDVEGNNLSSESVKVITSRVTHSSSLRILNMSHSEFSVPAVVDLASLLSDQLSCKMEELVLWHCNISSEGMVALATALCKNSTLRTLNLKHNPIGQEGAAAIAQMLPQNRTLRRIVLHDNYSIGEEGIRQLDSSLNENSILEKIWLPPKYKYISNNPRIVW